MGTEFDSGQVLAYVREQGSLRLASRACQRVLYAARLLKCESELSASVSEHPTRLDGEFLAIHERLECVFLRQVWTYGGQLELFDDLNPCDLMLGKWHGWFEEQVSRFLDDPDMTRAIAEGCTLDGAEAARALAYVLSRIDYEYCQDWSVAE